MALENEAASHMAALQGTIESCSGTVVEIVERLCVCFNHGGRLYLCGNGGSAADAQHVAAEFVNRLRLDRRPLPAVALTTDTSVLTCLANDVDFNQVFARQLEALGRKGDVLLALSTSGKSANILAALAAARRVGMETIGLTGRMGGACMSPHCDVLVSVPSDDCPRIQECHEFVCHVVAGMVEEKLFGSAHGVSSGEEPGHC